MKKIEELRNKESRKYILEHDSRFITEFAISKKLTFLKHISEKFEPIF